MKLELKHIAPYLPYGLKCKLHGCNTIWELSPPVFKSDSNERTLRLHLITNDYGIETGAKLVLRPLSDLRDKKKSKLMAWIQEQEDGWSFDGDGELLFTWRFHKNKSPVWVINSLPYWIIEKLFENHFDVFDLIKAGLAIDINTLKEVEQIK